MLDTSPPRPPQGVLELTDSIIGEAMELAAIEMAGGRPQAATSPRFPETGSEGNCLASPRGEPASAIPGGSDREKAWTSLVMSCTDLSHFGFYLAWGVAHGFHLKGMSLLQRLAKPFATQVASTNYRGLFPLPVDFSFLSDLAWPLADCPRHLCEQAWMQLIALALNHLHGDTPPYPASRHGASVKKSMAVLLDRVKRFLSSPVKSDLSAELIWDDMKTKTLNYSGEEVALAQPLTVEQVLSSMPPEGHGGSVDLLPLLEGRSRFLLSHPEEVILPPGDIPVGKNTAKVHLKKGSELEFFLLLKQRGIITFVREEDVFEGPQGKYLSGLFGVPKPGKTTASGLPVLRLIMNLTPINRAMGVILADIGQLPSASVWQQLVLAEGDTLTVSQADMSCAFYLFRLPPQWSRYLCFNHGMLATDVGEAGPGRVYPACAVLPMGWSSSVGIMQMASRELLRRAHLHSGHELRKRALVPRWFLRIAKGVPEGGSSGRIFARDGFLTGTGFVEGAYEKEISF